MKYTYLVDEHWNGAHSHIRAFKTWKIAAAYFSRLLDEYAVNGVVFPVVNMPKDIEYWLAWEDSENYVCARACPIETEV